MPKSIARLAFVSLVFWTLPASQALAADPPLRPDQTALRELYEELVETNTTLNSGSCTLAAERMAARLKAARNAGQPNHPLRRS